MSTKAKQQSSQQLTRGFAPYQETKGEEYMSERMRAHFTAILNKWKQELMYLCLALGFEGKYRVMARGVLDLDGISDALYRQIRQLRGDVPRELSPHWQGLSDQRRGLVRIVPWWMVALFTLVCLVVMYSGFAWVLGEQRDTVLQPYQSLDAAAGQPGS